MKLKKISSMAILALLFFPLAAFAFTFSDGETKLPPTLTDDYYTAGQNILLSSPIYGDMIAAGAEVEIDAPISQDLVLVGGNILIQGEIGDDARIAGGDIRFDSIIKDDLIVGGGDITITDRGFVGGDFVFGSGSVRIDGVVNGNILGLTNVLTINNEIKGNVRLMDVEKVIFGPKGKVLGDFSYRSHKPSASISSETVKGKIEYSATEVPIDQRDFRKIAWGILSGFSLFSFLSLLFTGLFFLWGLRFLMVHAVDIGTEKSLPSLGIGLLAAFVTPLLALVLLVTGVGLPLALILLMSWCLILFVGKLVGVMVVGMRLIKTDGKSSFPRLYWAFAVGAFVFSIIAMIPVLGWILRFLLSLLGIGALLSVLAGLYQTEHKKKNV